jgi:hypothetical protein
MVATSARALSSSRILVAAGHSDCSSAIIAGASVEQNARWQMPRCVQAISASPKGDGEKP